MPGVGLGGAQTGLGRLLGMAQIGGIEHGEHIALLHMAADIDWPANDLAGNAKPQIRLYPRLYRAGEHQRQFGLLEDHLHRPHWPRDRGKLGRRVGGMGRDGGNARDQ